MAKPQPHEKDYELYYCGHCKREQRPEQGSKCISCGRRTVSYYPNKQSHAEAQAIWERLYGEK